MARNMATILTAELHPTGSPKISPSNQISVFVSSRIPNHLDEDRCPLEMQPFAKDMLLL